MKWGGSCRIDAKVILLAVPQEIFSITFNNIFMLIAVKGAIIYIFYWNWNLSDLFQDYTSLFSLLPYDIKNIIESLASFVDAQLLFKK